MYHQSTKQVSGHAYVVERRRGPQFYVKYRLASGKQVQRRLGPVWQGRGRPPEGHFTKRTADEALQAILSDARRGLLPDPGDRSGKTFSDACSEWLRYLEVERERAPSTLRDYRNVVRGSLIPEFGPETSLDQITTVSTG